MEDVKIVDMLTLLNGKDFWTSRSNTGLGLREVVFSDGPSGLRFQTGENDHLGMNESCKATCFPTPAALSCSWDPDLVSKVSSCIAKEAVDKGVDVVLAPGINIKRSPLCGRNFEYFSEDPFLTKELGAAFVRGLQENGIGSSLKHFAANNQESYRMSADMQIDERALNEIYLKAFKEIVEETQPWTVMSAYNRLNGEYCSENKWLLTDLLREKWGYKGLVVSDWYAVNDIVKCIKSGLDLEMPSVGETSLRLLQEAYENGSLDKDAVDRAVGNLCTLAAKCDNTLKVPGNTDYAKHHAIAGEAAAASIVLLKNDKKSLPLTSGEKILCIGELMNSPVIQGNGSSRVNAMVIDSIPEELSKAGLTYIFESGYRQDTETADEELFAKAVEEAQNADKIIFFAGHFNYAEAEGYDRESLRLPECQNDLIDHLSRLGKELIVVLQTGSAVEMPWIDGVDSVLQMHLSGEGAGHALADILTGKVNPSGKLTETYPEKLSHIPSYLNKGGNVRAVYHESIFVGYRYYDKKDLAVLFPFGYGLSYTEFSYDTLEVERAGDDFLVSLQVTNTGSCEGKEIVQVYVGLNETAVLQPVRCLAAFKKVSLSPGASDTLRFILPVRQFMYYDEIQKEFVFATGENTIEVGKSSRSIELQTTVQITDSNRQQAAINRNTTIGELQNIPELREIVEIWMNALLQQFGLPEGDVVSARELEQSIYYMPLRNTVQISNGAFSFAELDGFTCQLNEILKEMGRLV